MKCSLKDGFINILLIIFIAPSKGVEFPLLLQTDSVLDKPMNFQRFKAAINRLQDLDSFPDVGDSENKLHKIVKKQMAAPDSKESRKSKRSILASFNLPETHNRAANDVDEVNLKAEEKIKYGENGFSQYFRENQLPDRIPEELLATLKDFVKDKQFFFLHRNDKKVVLKKIEEKKSKLNSNLNPYLNPNMKEYNFGKSLPYDKFKPKIKEIPGLNQLGIKGKGYFPSIPVKDTQNKIKTTSIQKQYSPNVGLKPSENTDSNVVKEKQHTYNNALNQLEKNHNTALKQQNSNVPLKQLSNNPNMALNQVQNNPNMALNQAQYNPSMAFSQAQNNPNMAFIQAQNNPNTALSQVQYNSNTPLKQVQNNPNMAFNQVQYNPNAAFKQVQNSLNMAFKQGQYYSNVPLKQVQNNPNMALNQVQYNPNTAFKQGQYYSITPLNQVQNNPNMAFNQVQYNPNTAFKQGQYYFSTPLNQVQNNPNMASNQVQYNPNMAFNQVQTYPNMAFNQVQNNPNMVFKQGQTNPDMVFNQVQTYPNMPFNQVQNNPNMVFNQGQYNSNFPLKQLQNNPKAAKKQEQNNVDAAGKVVTNTSKNPEVEILHMNSFLRKKYTKIPDEQDYRFYYECEKKPFGSMKLVHKRCPEGQFFSYKYLKCLKASTPKCITVSSLTNLQTPTLRVWKEPAVKVLKESTLKCFKTPALKKLTKTKRAGGNPYPKKIDIFDTPEDPEPSNEWMDANQGPIQKIPPEFKPKKVPGLKIYHLCSTGKLYEMHRNTKKSAAFGDSNSKSKDSKQGVEGETKCTVKRESRTHHPRSFVIHIKKKEGKENQDQGLAENDENDEEENDEDDDEEDSEDEEDEAEEEVQENLEEKSTRKDGLKELFKSAKAAVTNRARFTDPIMNEPYGSQKEIASKTKKSEESTNSKNKNKKVLIDANIKLDSTIGSALKYILKSKTKENKDSHTRLREDEALISDRESQDQLDPELIRKYEHMIRNNPRVKRYFLANCAMKGN